MFERPSSGVDAHLLQFVTPNQVRTAAPEKMLIMGFNLLPAQMTRFCSIVYVWMPTCPQVSRQLWKSNQGMNVLAQAMEGHSSRLVFASKQIVNFPHKATCCIWIVLQLSFILISTFHNIANNSPDLKVDIQSTTPNNLYSLLWDTKYLSFKAIFSDPNSSDTSLCATKIPKQLQKGTLFHLRGSLKSLPATYNPC